MKACIITFGCQMNKYTSRVAESVLNKLGYAATTQEEEADLILVNTCSVRASAEERAIGRIKALAGLKRRNPKLKIGVVGCMAARLADSLFELIPQVDFSLGPNEIGRLSEVIEKGKSILSSSGYNLPPQAGKGALREFVAISTGCNNHCSYCIVPSVRGRLALRPPEEILSEIRILAESGTKEITLLGQDVTSYRFNETGFPDLLLAVSSLFGIERVRFLTSHPKGVEEDLIDTVAGNHKICAHFHLPLQSGSNRVLQDMKRGYTADYYFRLIDRIRQRIPHCSITTDIIVGFPTEDREDFEATLSAIERVRPDASFCFAYSARPGTPAERLPEIDQKEKLERLKEVIELTKKIAEEKNRELIGTNQEVLIEGRNPRDPKGLLGRTTTDKVCLVEAEADLIGKTVSLHIIDSSAYTLKGKLERSKEARRCPK